MKRHLFGGAHTTPKVRLSGTAVPLAHGSRRVRESCTFAHPVLIPSFAGTSGLRSTGRPGRDVAELLLASGHAIIDVASAAAVGQLLAQQRPLRRLAVRSALTRPSRPWAQGCATRVRRERAAPRAGRRRWRGREAAAAARLHAQTTPRRAARSARRATRARCRRARRARGTRRARCCSGR